MPKGMAFFCVWSWGYRVQYGERAVTKKCVCVFVCVQIIYTNLYFSALESTPDGT